MNSWQEVWPNTFRFSFAKGKVPHRDLIIEAVNRSTADKVLVVGGLISFEQADYSLFSHRRVFLNIACSLPQLCEVCISIRESQERAVVISNFPSEVDPPRTSWVTGIERREWSAPAGTSLELAKDRDTVAVLFGAVANTSYYEKVLRAQGWPAREILECAVLGDGHGLIFDHQLELAAGASEQRVRELFIGGSDSLEFFGKRDGRGDRAGILHT